MRPLKRSTELRHRVSLYLSAAERQLAEDKASDAGLSLASFLRQAALARRLTAIPLVSAARWAELAHTTANLNQLLRHLNTGTAPFVSPALVKKLLDEVQALRHELVTGGDR